MYKRQKLDGVAQLLDCIVDLVPSAADAAGEVAETMDGEPVELKVSEDDPTAAIVFKTVADPFVGKLSYFKVIIRINQEKGLLREKQSQFRN